MAYKIEQLKEWLTEHAQLKEQMAEGEAYFNQQNTAILETKKQMGIIRNDKNGKRTVMVEDPYASNQKLASGFLKQQIKQKVNYLINENITLSDMVEETEELYPDWRKDLKQLSTRVSYHIYGAWQFYVEDNETKYKFIDGTQLYPIFITNQSIPDLVIRHYTTMDGIEKAIIYSNTTETHYIKKKKWEYEKEVPIIRKSKVIADETIEEQSVELSQPPFAICFNNDEWKTDLQPIKSFVDIYDKVNSDFANNIIDFQEIYHTVKNYDGQDLEEFNEQLKRLKVVPVGEDGEMQTHQIEVPVNAKQTFLELTRKNIFEFGMAVDVQNIATGNATVVAIQSMYENLNMKAADFEQELQDFWRQVVKLTNEFNLITGSAAVIDNYLMFDKSMISNVNEVYERLSKYVGVLPNQILFRLLPDVDETEAMELMEEEVNQLKTQLLDEQALEGEE
jgi:SPP1 family phage portal protein